MIITYLSQSLSYGFLVLLFLFGGCSHKGKVGTVSKQDPQDQSPQPEMKKVEFGGGLDKKLELVRITQGKVDGDLLRIQVELKNISSREVKCTHRLEWLDGEGFLVKDTSLVWKALMVRPGESKMIESISTRAGVTAFRLKNPTCQEPMKFLLCSTVLLASLLVFSCGERKPVGRAADARYLEDGSNKGLVNLGKINAQDFTRAANQLVTDLLASGSLSEARSQPAILHIGEIRNDTQTYFDTDLLLQGMKRDLLASKKVRISTTAGPEGKISDAYADSVRKELGAGGDRQVGVPRPYFSLSGKIIEETSRVDAVTQKDFYFLLTLTELNGGTGVWFGRELITKQGSRGAIGF